MESRRWVLRVWVCRSRAHVAWCPGRVHILPLILPPPSPNDFCFPTAPHPIHPSSSTTIVACEPLTNLTYPSQPDFADKANDHNRLPHEVVKECGTVYCPAPLPLHLHPFSFTFSDTHIHTHVNIVSGLRACVPRLMPRNVVRSSTRPLVHSSSRPSPSELTSFSTFLQFVNFSVQNQGSKFVPFTSE